MRLTGSEPTLNDADSKERAVIVQNTATIKAAISPKCVESIMVLSERKYNILRYAAGYIWKKNIPATALNYKNMF